jgi:hypothetical protein
MIRLLMTDQYEEKLKKETVVLLFFAATPTLLKKFNFSHFGRSYGSELVPSIGF